MRDSKLIYEELTDVPSVPENAFMDINRRIKRNASRKQLLLAVAATFLLSISASTWFYTNRITSTSLQPEVAYELQNVRDFLNGDDIESENNQLVLLVDDF